MTDTGPKSVPKQRAVLWGIRDGGEHKPVQGTLWVVSAPKEGAPGHQGSHLFIRRGNIDFTAKLTRVGDMKDTFGEARSEVLVAPDALSRS